ncbi:hypothetical protein [Seleniivibrio sp.]|uniref:hypothetical protein n=1 Tax=Seleniivibrio sp. TaxID=2898801 RepID=UPI0025F47DB6|nr:hypothetical protein [Seleniivibrio sp.]MCD8554234.1 hypothetical protein [Seleniivibrio sp.]
MLNKDLVFILENGKNALVINLNNFNTIEFDDANMSVMIDHGTSERNVDFDNKKSYSEFKAQIVGALIEEEEQ